MAPQLEPTHRILKLKKEMLNETRFVSIEQARIITEVYQKNPELPRQLLRAKSLAAALHQMPIRITPGELIVGNRTPGVRSGVVFPEAGISWLAKEWDSLPTRPQDPFGVHPEDTKIFFEEIEPFWRGKTLHDIILAKDGSLIDEISMVVKINQKDHAQGHICPDTKGWIEKGPSLLCAQAKERLAKETDEKKKEFYHSTILVLEAAIDFIHRYGIIAREMAAAGGEYATDLEEVANVCEHLATRPAQSFHEALQSTWFLYVILQMESNASSFSPGRMDQYLYPYYQQDIESGRIDDVKALELIECLWLKFNQIVYLRNSHSASFFAGFPIGFNVAIGGQTSEGEDATNPLSYLMLKAQERLLLPQPNLSARLFEGSSQEFLLECSKVIGKGSGMPQIFNDRSIIPALRNQGITPEDATNYAIVGCVELTTHGNNLGWSDAAMFNGVKALELAINGGRCLVAQTQDRSGAITEPPSKEGLSSESIHHESGTAKGVETVEIIKTIQLGPNLGTLVDFHTYEDLEKAFAEQIHHFIQKMLEACNVVEEAHQLMLPSPFLSCVIDDCLKKGLDVTKGGAKYNLSGIQFIQPANIADSLMAIKKLVYDEKRYTPAELLDALRTNFRNREQMRQVLLNAAPKYGNDCDEVDLMAAKWVEFFAKELEGKLNFRGGKIHTGLYTVSAHVPMGQNVGATADGRRARAPLADGGVSAVYGRDTNGPTALLKSVAKIDSKQFSNGTLLNMKFLPSFFATQERIEKFASLLRGFVHLNIHHVQFNVVDKEVLIAAQKAPENYRNITIRVAGYTAYFVELARDLQDEIIARTTFYEL